MNKKILVIFAAAAMVAALGAGCGKGGATGDSSGGGGLFGGSLITDMCGQISADFVGQAAGKTVVKTEPGPGQPDYCQYFFDSKNFVSLNYDNYNVENQKKGLEILDRKIETNDKIKMEHFLAIQEDGLINSIYLILDPDRFVSVNRSSGKALGETEVVDFAAKVAELLKKGVPAAPPPEQAASQIERAKEFLNELAGGKIDDALAMMDANQATKEMWKTTFNTIQSLKIKSVEPAFQDEWTATRQVFRAVLDAKVTSEGVSYGWNQGENNRWITLEKNGDTWQVHELANNP